MTSPEVLDLARDSLWTMLLVASPMMIVALIVGLVISLFQALTQIQEMTLTFVPKLLTMCAVFVLTAPFMGRTLGAFMERLIAHVIASQ